MSLDPLHEEVAALALALPEASQIALAGGGALLAHDLVDRPTQDIDLFTPDQGELGRVTDALAAALHEGGYIVEVSRRVDTFAHLDLTAPDGQTMAVELAVDARIRDTVQLRFGPVLHPDEVAADKTLALFGRATARDLIDVDALAARYGRERLFELAVEKDRGFDRRVFADALAAASAQPDLMYQRLGLDADRLAALRHRAAHWRADLHTGSVDSSPDPAQAESTTRQYQGPQTRRPDASPRPPTYRTSERRSGGGYGGRSGPAI